MPSTSILNFRRSKVVSSKENGVSNLRGEERCKARVTVATASVWLLDFYDRTKGRRALILRASTVREGWVGGGAMRLTDEYVRVL